MYVNVHLEALKWGEGSLSFSCSVTHTYTNTAKKKCATGHRVNYKMPLFATTAHFIYGSLKEITLYGDFFSAGGSQISISIHLHAHTHSHKHVSS